MFKGKRYILRYEDLNERFPGTVKSLVKALMGMEIEQDVLTCLVKNREGKYHRPSSNFTREDVFTRNDEKQLLAAKESVDVIIENCVQEGLCLPIVPE